MYNESIHKRIEHIGYLISDIKSCDADISISTDPSLILEYTEEMKVLNDELTEAGVKCIQVLEAYMKDCKDNDIPIFLDYYRVLNALKNAQVLVETPVC